MIACAIIWDVVCQNAPFPSSESNVKSSNSQSSEISVLRSTISPLTFAQVAALANPSLISFAMSSTDMLAAYSFEEPSFNVIFMFLPSLFLVLQAIYFYGFLNLLQTYYGNPGMPVLETVVSLLDSGNNVL